MKDCDLEMGIYEGFDVGIEENHDKIQIPEDLMTVLDIYTLKLH